MTIFESNCRAIEKQDSILAERLRAFSKETATLYRGKNKEYVLTYKGRLFNSRYGPWKEADQQADEILGKKPDSVALFGLGCGYLMRTLLKRGTQKIFIYEPSMEILKGVLMKVDLSREFSGQRVYLANYIGPFIARVQQFTEGIDSIIGYHTMPYRLLYQGELKEFLIKIQNAHTSQMVGIKTEIDSRLDWLMNYFANLNAFSTYPSVDVLKNKFKGVPMIIVGAGPSLRKNVALLAGIKDRAFIVSAVTAYKSLLSYGITPHAVISGEKVNLEEYFDGGGADKKIRLILSEVSHPEMFGRDARGKFIFYSPFLALSLQQASLWGSKSFVSIGGSVTTAMFDMGVMFGCDPIIFLGQDLAFDKDMTHVGGGVYDKQRIVIDKDKGVVKVKEHYISGHRRTITHKLQWLQGVNGEPVASKYDWVTFHQWFERYTALLKEQFPQIRVYNATEGGAFIKGMEHISLKEVIERDLRECAPVDKILQRGESTPPDIDINGLIESFTNIEDKVGLVAKLSGKIIKDAGILKVAFISRGLHTELGGRLDGIRKKERRLFKAVCEVSFLWEALVEYTYDLKQYLKEDEDISTEDQFRKDIERTIRTYKEVRKMCLLFLPKISEALALVRGMRLERRGEMAAAVNKK